MVEPGLGERGDPAGQHVVPDDRGEPCRRAERRAEDDVHGLERLGEVVLDRERQRRAPRRRAADRQVDGEQQHRLARHEDDGRADIPRREPVEPAVGERPDAGRRSRRG